jgi:hypothetical protein
MGVESKLYELTDETIVCCKTETRGVDRAGPRSADSRCDLGPFLRPVGKLCTTLAREQRRGRGSAPYLLNIEGKGCASPAVFRLWNTPFQRNAFQRVGVV